MADERKNPRKWSLEEIDELLQDSGLMPRGGDALEYVEEIEYTPKAVSFNPRPSHNENIEHRIIKETVERSDSVAEPQVYGAIVSEKYRDRFYNKPVQNIEKTSEHKIIPPEEQKFERGGFVRKKSNFESTSDFSPVPNLVPDNKSADEPVTDKTVVFNDKKHTRTIGLRSLAVTDGDAHEVELPEEEDDAQLTFEGFHSEETNTVDEKEIEEELNRKRKEKTENFTITGDITEEEKDETSNNRKYGTDEYRTADDKFKVSYYLKKKRNTAVAGAVISYISFVLLMVISMIAKNATTGGIGYVLVALLLTIIPSAVNFEVILDGIKAIKGFNFNRNTGCFVALAATLIQQIVFLFSTDPFEKGLSLFAPLAVLVLAFTMTGEFFELKRVSDNFLYITRGTDIYSIGPIEKTETAFEIGRGLLLDDPSVLSSQKTVFPRRFIELSRKYYPSDDISKRLIPIGLGVSLLVGVISLIVTKHFLSAVSAFSACVCVTVPYFSFVADTIAITKVSKKLRKNGGSISGWEAFRQCENANAVVVDSADVFDENGGNVYGIHLFYDIRIDEAIINTAALTIASGGPLGNLFKRVIVGEMSFLPPVDTLAYEDKLGLSAWIFNRRVLVGNGDLLRNHNVEIPDTALIERHLTEGRYPLYLAIDGKAAAVFIVSYDVNGDNARLLKKIERNSISVLVRSDDANITDEMVAKNLSLPRSGVKVLSAVSGDIYMNYKKETTSAADALLLHDGKASSFLYAVKSALSLGDFKQILNTFQICSMGIGVAIVAALSLVSGLEHMNCIQLVFVQLFFMGFSVFTISGGNLLKTMQHKKIRKKTIKGRRRPE